MVWPMRRLSSRATFAYKRIFPVVFIGFVVVFAGINVFRGAADPLWWMPALVVPAAMAVFGYSLMKRLVFDLVDEVIDDGDALIVRNGGDSDRIALSDIANVGYAPMFNPPRVTLALRKPSKFGDKVSFCAPIRAFSFTPHPLVEDLIRRVDAAREHRHRH
jgi:hypothetical protein